MTIHKDFGIGYLSSNHIHPDSPLFVGLECEIEGIRTHGKADQMGFNVTTDGSLRNNGYEYISPPLPIGNALESFKGLHSTITTISDLKFSNRTSIHVHANCLNLDSKVVHNIVMWYVLYEELFFLMCDADRRHNIHCVALTETYLPSLYGNSLNFLVSRWHKYTALNLKPLSKYGTIEFRHMQGHDDSKLLGEWLHAISMLFDLGKNVMISKDTFNDEILKMGFDRIFGETHLSGSWLMAKNMISNSVIDVKLGVQ